MSVQLESLLERGFLSQKEYLRRRRLLITSKHKLQQMMDDYARSGNLALPSVEDTYEQEVVAAFLQQKIRFIEEIERQTRDVTKWYLAIRKQSLWSLFVVFVLSKIKRLLDRSHRRVEALRHEAGNLEKSAERLINKCHLDESEARNSGSLKAKLKSAFYGVESRKKRLVHLSHQVESLEEEVIWMQDWLKLQETKQQVGLPYFAGISEKQR